jgi:hypothetical protein
MLHLIEKSGGAIGMKLLCHPRGGTSIESVFTPQEHGDIIISSTPKVSTDFFTLRMLNKASIDFSYATEDFIISRDPNVLLAKPERRQA